MGKKKELKKELLDVIMRMHQEGARPALIAKIVACSRTSVYGVIKRGGQKAPKRPGRPKKLSNHDRRRLYRAASNKMTSCRALKDQLNLPVHPATVHRELRSNPNFVWKKKKKRPKMTEQHAQVRMAWCGARNLWGEDEWKRVIFSDEKKFNLDGPDGLNYYWHDLRKEELYFSSRQGGGGSLMVWAAFGWNGRTALHIIEGHANAQRYIQALNNMLLPHLGQIADGPAIFQQDNAPIHTAQLTRQWLQQHNIATLPWPAKSPDLNPIENLWGIMVRRLYAGGRQYNSVEELRAAAIAIWNTIPQEQMRDLIRSMPNRTDLVLEANGWEIDKY